ncbi:MAG TPA: hypothetical protein VFT10_02165 [Solirubrobacterales bacterium]|nr:hypothetical protein [Solirubrobacterales bacterium]
MSRAALAAGTALLLAATSTANATSPSGPRLAFQVLNRAAESLEIETASDSGGQRRSVAGGSRRTVKPLPEFGFAPSWSPDGSSFVFGAHTGQGLRLFMASGEGGRPRVIPRTRGAFAPVFAPDGRTIAFARARIRSHIGVPKHGQPNISSYASATTWTIGVDGSRPRRLTPWRNGLEIVPSSFSPDGAVIASSRYDEGGDRFYDAITVHADGSGSALLAANALYPALSPDGSQVALIAYLPNVRPRLGRYGFYRGGLTVMRSDGTSSRLLTRTTFYEQSPPSWDPSGERLAYAHRTSVMQINADGSCRHKLFAGTTELLYFGPSWQPGVGREAGRIAC